MEQRPVSAIAWAAASAATWSVVYFVLDWGLWAALASQVVVLLAITAVRIFRKDLR